MRISDFSTRKLVGAFVTVLLGASLLTIFTPARATANPPESETPPGFRLVASATGVQLYQKDYAKGNPDFVQVVDLSQGAAIKLLHGEITEPRAGKGATVEMMPPIKNSDLLWDIASTHSTAFCVTTGRFFTCRMRPLAYPSPSKDGKIVTDGYAVEEFPETSYDGDLARAGRHPRADQLARDQPHRYHRHLSEDRNKRAKRHVRTLQVLMIEQTAGLRPS
jgi:hypothetical protein